MAVAKWATPSPRSSDLAGTTLNSLPVGNETGTAITYDNSTNRDLYGVVTIKLGSFNPGTAGSITLRVTLNDGTDTADRIGGDLYVIPLTSGASPKIAVINMIRLYPFPMRFNVVNNTAANFAASGNEFYLRPWNEDVT